MAAKRLMNQDPEYEPISAEVQEKRMKFIERDARNATIKKIERILRSQFGPEINNKTKEVEIIDDMLYEARQMIDRLRAQVVMKYYCEVGSKDNKSDESDVPSIHPTVKANLIGKAPKFTCSSSSESPVVKTEVPASDSTSAADSALHNSSSISSYSSEVASSRGMITKNDEISAHVPRMKTKCKIVIGNVSKFLPAAHRDDDDQSTHKWMIYVRGDKDRPSLEGVVKKVCFFLHPSYRPNDIVEVCNPPFHLVKRGWGEFTVRIRLYFIDPRNKPVDLYHQLKLDRTYTGLQTLGAEATLDLMLYKADDKAGPKSISVQSSPGPSHSRQAVPPEVVDKVIPSTSNITPHKENPSNPPIINVLLPPDKIKREKDELCIASNKPNSPAIAVPGKLSVSPVKNVEIKSHQLILSPPKAATPGPFLDKAKNPFSICKQNPQSKPFRTVNQVNQVAKNQVTNGVGTFIKCTDTQGRILLVPQTSLICVSSVNNNTVVKPFTVTQTVMQPQCSSSVELGKNFLGVPPSPVPSNAKLPSYVLKVIPTVQSRPNQVLLIPVSEGSSQKAQTLSSACATNNISVGAPSFQHASVNAVVTPQSPTKRTKPFLHWEQVMEGVRIQSYSSFALLLKKMMKVFPLISQEYDPASIPFCAPSVEVFQSWNIGKQRAAEWQRAGLVRFAVLKLLKTHSITSLAPEDVWPRREIMVWCRKNGYTPPFRQKSGSAPVDAHAGPTLTEVSTLSDSKRIIANLESQNGIPGACEDDDDEEIDIISVNTENKIKKEVQSLNCLNSCLPPSSPSVYFVKDAAAEIGVKLKPVEVEPSVFMPVIEEMIFAACKEFASDLVRASLVQGYGRMGGRLPPDAVTVQDVFSALQNPDSFDFLTHKHLGVLQEPLDQS